MTEMKDPRLHNREKLTEEQKDQYVEFLEIGFNPQEAAEEIGATGSNVRRYRSVNSRQYDPEFAERCERAIADAKPARLERLQGAAWKKAVVDGDPGMLVKFMNVYDEDFRAVYSKGMQIDVNIRSAVEQYLPGLSQELLDRVIAEMEQQAQMKELMPGPDGDG